MLQILAPKPDGSKKSASYLKMRRYPDDSFTIGANSPPRKDTQPSGTTIDTDTWWNGYKDVSAHHVTTDQTAIARHLADRHPHERLADDQLVALFNAYEASGQYDKALKVADLAARDPDSPMGLSVATNSHKSQTRKKRGLKGITSKGKRMVRSCGAILERDKDRLLSFLTCTIPSLPDIDNWAICQAWSEICRKFFQELSRLLMRRGLDANYVYVTEIQEKRFFGDQGQRQLGLHLHILFQGRKSKRHHWAISTAEVEALWQRVLSNQLGREVDCSRATKIESPRKSMCKELGKYMTKGSKIINAVSDAGLAHLLPSSWWGASTALKKQVKAEIQVYTGDVVSFILRNLDKYQRQGLLAYRHIYVEFTDSQTGLRREIQVGSVGFFKSSAALSEILKEFNNEQSLYIAA